MEDNKRLRTVASCSVDRISSLPDDLLKRIVCFLPTKDAVTTSTLSKKWRWMYTWITNLEFEASNYLNCSERAASFTAYVDSVLRECRSKDLTRFCLKLGKCASRRPCRFNMEPDRLKSWLSFPLTQRVKELDLCLYLKLPRGYHGTVLHEIFSCDVLEVLKLDTNLELELPMSFCLPNLKVFHLAGVYIPASSFLTGLLSSCPSLVELVLTECRSGDTQILKISSSSLRRFVLDLRAIRTKVETVSFPDREGSYPLEIIQPYERSLVVIDTPNLQRLEYHDNLALKYSGGNLSALDEATINIAFGSFVDETYFQSLLSLLRQLVNVQSLYFFESQQRGHLGDVKLKGNLVFRNLTRMELYLREFCYFKALLDLLHCSPLLERLTFSRIFGLSERDPSNPFGEEYTVQTLESEIAAQGVPSCFRSHLKTIMLGTYMASEEQVVILKYILANALVLQELDIACTEDLDLMDTEKALKKLPRGSVNCSFNLRLMGRSQHPLDEFFPLWMREQRSSP